MSRSPVHVFSPLIEQAIELASQWHDATYRKGRWRDAAFDVPPQASLSVPVMAHLSNVAVIVMRAGWDDVAVAAAFLHDVIEDGNRYGDELTHAQLTALIGPEVADCVRALSEPKRHPNGTHIDWKPRKWTYLAGLSKADVRTVAVSLADKLHNLWSINEALQRGIDVFASGPGRRALSAGPAEQLWFYNSVLEISNTWEDPRLESLRSELSREIERFEKLAGT